MQILLEFVGVVVWINRFENQIDKLSEIGVG